MKYAVILAGFVINVIILNISSHYGAGNNTFLVQSNAAQVGDQYNGSDFLYNAEIYNSTTNSYVEETVTRAQYPNAPTTLPQPAPFNVDLFVEQLASTTLATNPSVLPYYAVLKDLCTFNNWQQLANTMAGLLQGGILNQSDIDSVDSVLENQQINLDSYNSQINVSY